MLEKKINSITETEFKKQEKEKKWENLSARFNEEADRKGLGLDEHIKNTVISLNALGFNTVQSCEGHIGFGRSFPWISIGAPNEPEERFIDQKRIITETAKKYNCSYENVENPDNEEAYNEASRKYTENQETDAYKKWREENKKLEVYMQKLLNEFYENRSKEEGVQLITNEEATNFEIISKANATWKLSESQKGNPKEIEEKLKIYQKEMNDFADFLKKKFFEDSYIEP